MARLHHATVDDGLTMRALVLSGAGAGLFAHGGALDAIRRKREAIGYVTGASAGAIAAALYAAGREQRIGKLAETISSEDLWGNDGALPIATRVYRLIDRLAWFDHHALATLIERELDDDAVRAIAEGDVQLEIPAYDVRSGVAVWWPGDLGVDALRSAVLASASLPLALAPITLTDAAGVVRTLVDGGVTENHPIRRAAARVIDAGGGSIIVVSAMQPPRRGPLEGVSDLIGRLISAVLSSDFSADLEAATQLGVQIHVVQLGPLSISLSDFTQEEARAAYHQGYSAAWSAL